MKSITVIDPNAALLAVMSNVTREYVRTCHSDTCNCFSHDPGYDEVTGDVADEVTFELIGRSVHSHGTTIRTDDEVGQARKVLADARATAEHWHCFRSGSRAGARMGDEHDAAIDHARRVLELVSAGQPIAAARIQATAESEASARAGRKAKREAAIAAMEAGGMTHREAVTAYGIGQWSNEIDWCAVKKAIAERGPNAHQELSNGACAGSTRQLDTAVDWLFGHASFPRRTAWCAYACQIFWGWRRESQKVRDYPTTGNGWRLVS